MDLGEALYREITGKSPATEIKTFGQAIRYLVTRAGSASAAARVVGVAPSTFRHWISSGRRPSSERASFITELAMLQQRRDRLPAGRERRMRAPGALDDIRMVGQLTYDSAPEPSREVDLGTYMDEVQNQVLDAYLEGASLDELAEIFVEGIGDPFYHDTLAPEGEGDDRFSWDIDHLDGWA